jgi:hypothetical protein
MNDPSQPLKISSVAEEYEHIGSLRCERCGGGYRIVRQTLLVAGATPIDAMEIICQACEQEKRLLFDISSFFGK